MVASGDNGCDAVQLVFDRVDVFDKLVADNQQRRASVIDYLQHLRWSEPPVHRNVHRAEFGKTECHLEPLEAVLADEDYTVVPTYLSCSKCLRDLTGACVELSVSDRAAADLQRWHL